MTVKSITRENLEFLKQNLRDFEGIKRKMAIPDCISPLQDVINVNAANVKIIEGFGGDSAVLDIGADFYLLMAADSMWHRLIEADPVIAGYFCVLVNVNDIYAMGGTPVAMVDMLATTSKEIEVKIVKGLVEGCRKFGVPIVGGHLHPNAPVDSLGAAILGTVPKNDVIYSCRARPGDKIIITIDLDGNFHQRFPLAWDTTTKKTPGRVKEVLGTMHSVASLKLVNGSRDISNPGLVGTLGMLLEASGCGGILYLDEIPTPKVIEQGNITEFSRWLKAYPGFGMIMSVSQKNVTQCIEIFSNAGLDVASVGEVNASCHLLLETNDGLTADIFNFKKERMSGRVWK